MSPIGLLGIIGTITSLIALVLGIVALQDVQRRNIAGKGRAIFAITTGTFCLVVLLCFGISNSGGGRSSGNRSAVLAAVHFVEFAIRNENDFYDWSKRDAEEFGKGLYWTFASELGDSKNGQIQPKPAFRNTYELLRLVGDRADDIRNADIYRNIPPRPRDKFQRELRELICLSIEEIERAGGKVSKPQQ